MTSRNRARALGIAPGIYQPGLFNALTDVPGVAVGHLTLIEGDDIRTGATAILPHGGNLFQEKVPAGVAVANGFGKMTGVTQLCELGELETPLILTNTLAVPRAADALISHTLVQKLNEEVRSVNPVVGETNDGWLNDIRRRALTVEHFLQSITLAISGRPVEEGSVGAGTGTVCFNWKGGIGTSSRRLPEEENGYMLGVLVQANYGGQLHILGKPVAARLFHHDPPRTQGAGSIVIVVATDAPLSDHSLTRLARRSFAGLARTGSAFANSSGDYAIAFSTSEEVRRTKERRQSTYALPNLPHDHLSPLFQAAIEATEEAIYNALFMATSMIGYRGHTVPALPLESLAEPG